MRYLKTNTLYCFSPLVMIATFAIEIVLAVYTLWRYRSEKVTLLIVAILVLLAIFQLAEYNVCTEAFGVDSLTWSRIGFVAITFLPALGVHSLMIIAKRPNAWLTIGIYTVALLFAAFFLLAAQGVSASVCNGNYVIFESAPTAMKWYGLYYYGLEIVTLGFTLFYATRAKSKQIKKALYGLAVAYASLLIPTTTVNFLKPETIAAIPSIMCGFAVILALVMALYVLPLVATKR